MTDTGKTEQKLIDSIRKTKAAAGAASAPAAAPEKPAAPAPKRAQAAAETQVAADPYQSGRRVWPD